MAGETIVLGAGPAGLSAALALTRAGVAVTVVESAERVGGLCVTYRRDRLRYDLGGHILFVHDAGREAWLRELLGNDLLWVDRPVSSFVDGAVQPGRYLDQRSGGPETPAQVAARARGDSAADFLTSGLGETIATGPLRAYLEKVDGMPLEAITAARAMKLMVEQYAPRGFFYPAEGVGQLMDAMARAIAAGGGRVLLDTRVQAITCEEHRVTGVRIDGPAGTSHLPADHVVAGLPALTVTRLIDPSPPADLMPDLPPRAAIVVVLHVARDRVSDEPWIQVADHAVPFARLFEAKNWSERLVPPGETVLGCEVYCHPRADDPWWPLDDDSLGSACIEALRGPLGLLDARTAVRTVDIVRRARAWSLVSVDRVADAAAPARWVAGIRGLTVAQGGDVMLAIEAGERAVSPAEQ